MAFRPNVENKVGALEPLPLYKGDIRGSEPSFLEDQRRSHKRLISYRRMQQEEQLVRRSAGHLTESTKFNNRAQAEETLLSQKLRQS